MNLLSPRFTTGRQGGGLEGTVFLALFAASAALFTLLPARNAGSLSQLRFTISYERIQPGMTVTQVERLMGELYAVRGGWDLSQWYWEKENGNWYPQPTARPIPERFTGRISYLHDPFGSLSLDVAGIEFQDGKVVTKDIMWD